MSLCLPELSLNLTLNMKLDWTELSKGIDDSLQKNANWGKLVRPLLVGGGLTAAGAGAKHLTSKGVGYVEKGMEGLAPTAGNLLPSMLNNRFGGLSHLAQPGGLRPIINVNLAKPKTIFDMSPGEVGSLSSPNMGEGFVDNFKKTGELAKKADLVTDALARAAQMRLANKVIDSVSVPQQAHTATSPDDSKKIELVSKYPEMAEMLNKEENKAYLEKLLKEQS